MWTYMMAAARGDRATSIIQARNARYQNDDSNLSRWVIYGWKLGWEDMWCLTGDILYTGLNLINRTPLVYIKVTSWVT